MATEIGFQYFRALYNKRSTAGIDRAMELSFQKEISQRAVEVFGGDKAVLYRLGQQDNCVFGDIIRIQNSDLPLRVTDSLEISDLDINQIGRSSVFLYDKELKVLALQVRPQNVTRSMFAQYVRGIEDGCRVGFEPLISPETIADLISGRFRSIQFRVANPDHLEAIDSDTSATKGGLAALQSVSGSPTIEVKLTMGHSQGELKPRAIYKLVSMLRRSRDDAIVSKLEARVARDEAGYELVNLLDQKLVDERYVDLAGKSGQENFQARLDLIWASYQERLESLREQFGEPDDDAEPLSAKR